MGFFNTSLQEVLLEGDSSSLMLHPYTRFGGQLAILQKALAPLGWLFYILSIPKRKGCVAGLV